MQKKAADVAQFLERDYQNYPVILIYGVDRGAICCYGEKFLQKLRKDFGNRYNLEEIDATTLTATPTKLFDLAHSFPMFGEIQILWVKNANNQPVLLDNLQQLLKSKLHSCYIWLEGGDLKKGTRLRTLIEKSSYAMALPCYHDNDKDIIRFAQDICKSYKLSLPKEAAYRLAEKLGADHMLTYQEIEKLCLYVLPETTITVQHVEDIVSSNVADGLGEILHYFLQADITNLHHSLLRAQTQNLSLNALYYMIIRQLEQLEIIQYKCQTEGLNASLILDTIMPSLFYKRKAVILENLPFWPPQLLQFALTQLYQSRLEERKFPFLEEKSFLQTLFNIAAHNYQLRQKSAL